MTLKEMIELKESRGYSFKTLSEYSGVPVVTLQKIFSGATKAPRKATLDAIQRVFDADESVYQGKAFSYISSSRDELSLLMEPNPKYQLEMSKGEYTIKDYYALPDERRVELIDGIIYDMPAPNFVHQDIISIVQFAFLSHIKEKNKSCKVLQSPVDVQISCDEKSMVQPDLVVVCDKKKIRRFGIYGAPDFVLEVLSKSNRLKDMTVKCNKYQESGVREYWIIDPYKKVLITYDFTDEYFIPCVHNLDEKVPVMISDGELIIDLLDIAKSIEEFGELE